MQRPIKEIILSISLSLIIFCSFIDIIKVYEMGFSKIMTRINLNIIEPNHACCVIWFKMLLMIILLTFKLRLIWNFIILRD